MKKASAFLSALPCTIVGSLFLVASLVLMIAGVRLPIDPAWVCVLICGYPLVYLAIWRIIFNKGISKISSALMITIAMLAAIFIGELFAAGEVALIMAVGAILEDKTVERAQRGMKALINLAPRQGRRLNNGTEQVIQAEQIVQGDVLRVRPGEVIPADGEILDGDTSIDQSVVTGESLPVNKTVGDQVFCGTLNRFGSVDIRATMVDEDSSLQKLIRMVQEAENNQAPLQRIADRWAAWLVPLVTLLALAVFLISQDIIRAVTIMVVFCPCALVLATPTSVMAAIGQATKHGVIIKSGDALERMGKVDTIAFDKTGTLTEGSPAVSDIIGLAPGTSNETLLSLAASAESRSEHPLGKAVTAQAAQLGLKVQDAQGFQALPGKGVRAQVGDQELFCGNVSWLMALGVAFDGSAIDLP